jgi:hypothetical protein
MTLKTTVAFVIALVALLTSSPVMWREDHLRNFGVLQTVHFSILVTLGSSLILASQISEVQLLIDFRKAYD